MILAPVEGALLERTLDSTWPLWKDGLDRRAYGRYWAAQVKTAWGRTNLDRVGLIDGGAVLCSAKRYRLDGRLDGCAVRILGIGAVFTPPAARGRGFARRLIDLIVSDATDNGYDIAMLFSEIGPAYYERAGFTTVPTRGSEVVVSPGRGGTPMLPVRSLDDRDLPLVAEMHAVRAAPFRLHLDRPTAFVQYGLTKKRLHAGLARAGLRDVQAFAAEEGGRAVAFVVIAASASGWVIEECGDRDPAGARVGAILQGLLARTPSEARPRITAWLPPGFAPPQTEVRDIGPPREIMMARPLDGRVALSPSLTSSDVCYWHGDAF